MVFEGSVRVDASMRCEMSARPRGDVGKEVVLECEQWSCRIELQMARWKKELGPGRFRLLAPPSRKLKPRAMPSR